MIPTTYTTHATPIGDMLFVHSPDGLVAAQVLQAPLAHAIEPIAHALRSLPDPDDTSPASRTVCTQVDEYFAGERTRFDVELDWQLTTGFLRDALQRVREIPYAETASYGEIAALAGRPRAHRAVGTACRTTPFSLIVPVHRVVRSDGSLGEYGSSPETKRYLVEHERNSSATVTR